MAKKVDVSHDFAQAQYEQAARDYLESDRRVATNDLPKTEATVAAALRFQQSLEDRELGAGPLTEVVREQAEEDAQAREDAVREADEEHERRVEAGKKAAATRAQNEAKAERTDG